MKSFVFSSVLCCCISSTFAACEIRPISLGEIHIKPNSSVSKTTVLHVDKCPSHATAIGLRGGVVRFFSKSGITVTATVSLYRDGSYIRIDDTSLFQGVENGAIDSIWEITATGHVAPGSVYAATVDWFFVEP